MPAKQRENRDLPAFVIITGLSGSGMSSATDSLEDLGYFCVDNLPLSMLSTFGRLLIPADRRNPSIEKAALVINIRERHFLTDFPGELKKLEKRNLKAFVVFFEASDDVLQRRFSETRRPHPADSGKGLLHAIRAERRALKEIRKLADLIVDTSEHTVHTLRHFLVQKFSGHVDGVPLKVEVMSFGHKYGNPRGVDLMFDVRHLPNPYFQKDLKHLTGDDPEIIKYLLDKPEVNETIDRFADLLLYLLPRYQREGKSYVTIGIGCTGGKHRSVMVANSLRKALRKAGFDTAVSHRDIQK
ncbi:MAG TPA: RNase adapter RapZ [Pyrinomonadaceae bacterium]|nr:RNase adapter RapZ [Acidobacteriota bacterium]HQZ95158.1 RNase adapter RapZ [Pyrinomonadaceae bacterium]